MKVATVSLLLLLTMTAAASAAEYRLVCNNGVPVSTLSKQAASDIFMKRTPKWSDGTAIVVVDQSETSAVRARFSMDIHGKSVSAVVSYWHQQIFAGRAIPPVEQASEADVIAMVRKTPGAIGYVSDKALMQGVKIIDIQ